MKQPSYLKPKDKVCILSTARKITRVEVQPAIELYKSWGLKVHLSDNLFAEEHQFAGTVDQRLNDLQTALDDTAIKAIFFARGGYGTVQLVDQLDFAKFIENPKWLVGYSDITVLHNHINQNFGIETIHGMMPVSLLETKPPQKVIQSLYNALFGRNLNYEIESSPQNTNVSNFQGELVGGNLSIIYSLSGTASQISTENKILFIEDLDEYLYHIDRMIQNLLRADVFKGCKGLLVGGMSDMNDNKVPFGKSANEIILHNLEPFGFPIIFNVPSGHIQDNRTLILNRNLKVSTTHQSIKLEFDGRA